MKTEIIIKATIEETDESYEVQVSSEIHPNPLALVRIPAPLMHQIVNSLNESVTNTAKTHASIQTITLMGILNAEAPVVAKTKEDELQTLIEKLRSRSGVN